MNEAMYQDIPGLSEEERAILKRQRIAEAMLAQGGQPVQPFQQAGRYVAPMHFTQGLAQLVQAILGRKGVDKSQKELGGLAGKQQEMIAQALTESRAKAAGGPTSLPGTGVGLDTLGDPEGAMVDLIGNPAVPESTRQAEMVRYQGTMRREEKDEDRKTRLEAARIAAQERADALRERMEDQRLNREQRADAARERNDIMLQIAGIRTDASAQKPPSGFRFKEDGTLEAIPGGPADVKAKTGKDKEIAAKRSVDSVLDAEISNIDKLIGQKKLDKDGNPIFVKHPGLDAAVGSVDVRFPTVLQDTADAEAYIESLQSKASINALRDVKSGGSQSIGQITEREWPRLESMKATLQMKQGDAQYPQSLYEYREELLRTKSAAAAQLQHDFGDEASATQTAPVGGKKVVRTGTKGGRKVVMYDDGTAEYAD